MDPLPTWAEHCTCPLDYRGLGILYGVSLGKGWIRLSDDPACPEHGHGHGSAVECSSGDQERRRDNL